jgi:gliding motility-associated-like protein
MSLRFALPLSGFLFLCCSLTAATAQSPTLSADLTPVTCNGGSDGAIALTVNDGTPPYTFQWDNMATSSSLTLLTAGTYCVTVTDDTGATANDCYTVTQPDAIEISLGQVVTPNCFGAAGGSLEVSVTGGSGSYDYFWSHDPFLDAPLATDLSAGTYSVVVFDTNNCTDTLANISLDQPDSLQIDFTTVGVSCFGGNDGSATAVPVGGTGPYSFAWADGPTTDDYSSLSSGTYVVSLTDANGCSAVDSVLVAEPATPVGGTVSQTMMDCAGGNQNQATAAGSGGTPPYTYLWDNGTTQPTADNLTPGPHTVTVTDVNGCSETLSVTITTLAPIRLTAALTAPLCNGDSNGSITITNASGGAGGYTYLWANGTPGNQIDGLAGGNYCVAVTDAMGCTLDTCFNLFEPEPLQFNLDTIIPVSCFGQNNGSIVVDAEGGTGSLTLTWSHDPTLNSESAPNLPAGTYAVTVTDESGCTELLTGLSVPQPDSLALSFSTVDVTCFGEASGSATVQATGGTLPYTFAWENGPATPSYAQLPAGTYPVSVTDARGCVTVDTARIAQPATAVSGSAEQTRQGCFGAEENEALVMAQGGDGNYTYLWDNGDTTPLATGLSPGFHTVTVTDGAGCDQVVSVEVIDLPPVTVTTVQTSDPTCNAGTDGSITVEADGGTGLYSYNWDIPATGSTVDQLGAGTYCVTISDDAGCTTDTCFVLEEPAPLTLAVADRQDVSCFGGMDGRIELSTTGGAGTLTFSWDYDPSLTGGTVTGLAAGSYSVSVFDENNCTQSLSDITISQPDSLALSFIPTDVSCRDGNDGSASVTATGGTAPYTFVWSDGTQGPANTGLTAGTYPVIATDANGCQTLDSIRIEEPLTAVSAVATQTESGCFGTAGNSAEVTAAGGTPPYTFRWDDGQTTALATGLSAGLHEVTVTDSLGCTTVASVTLSDLSPLLVQVSDTMPTCFEQTDGRIEVSASGSTGGYTFQWSDSVTGASREQLGAGTYCLTVSDAAGCQVDTCITLDEPAPIEISLVASNPTLCYGGNTGSLQVTATGGTGTLSYLWNDELSQISDTAVFLAAGLYDVTVTDTRGCNQSLTGLEVTQPDSIELTFEPLTVSCREGTDGSATAMATGGTPGYSFVWDTGQSGATLTGQPAGRYTVTVTDNLGCQTIDSVRIDQPMTFIEPTIEQTVRGCSGASGNEALASATGGVPGYTYRWDNDQTTAAATGLDAGPHLVTITDAAGCSIVDTIELIDLTPISFTLIADAPSCNGDDDGAMGITQLAGGSGTEESDYTFLWSTGSTEIVTTGLTGGQTYGATVTDSQGCTGVRERQLPEPPAVNFELLPRPVSCFGGDDGAILLTNVTGPNTGGYQVSWSTGVAGSQDTLLSGLSAADYSATVTDALGCEAVRSVSVPQPLSLNVSIQKSEIACFQGTDGGVALQISGGVPDYTVAWTDGATGRRRTDLGAGSYTFEITDANGCTLAGTTTLQQPPAVTTVAETEDVTCTGDPSGRIQLTTTGGVPPYEYSLDNETFNGTGTFLGIFAGTYPVYVRDAAGCAYELQVTVVEPDALSVDLGPDIDLFFGDSIQLEAAISNAIGTVSYFWRGGYEGTLSCDTCPAPVASPEFTIDYFLTIIDENGCMAEDMLRVNVRKERVVEVPTAFTPNGDNTNDRLLVHGLPGTRVDVFRVFDRWGELLFEDVDFPVNAPDRGWDGAFRNDPMPGGVYIWQAAVIFPDGSEATYSGQTTLIR